jgi:hypothetical protein
MRPPPPLSRTNQRLLAQNVPLAISAPGHNGATPTELAVESSIRAGGGTRPGRKGTRS